MTTDLEQRLREALHEDAERARLVNPSGPPAPEARPLIVDRHRRLSARRLVAVAAAIALIAAAGVAVIQDRDQGHDVDTTPRAVIDIRPGSTVELPPAPLSPRGIPALVWTGSELIVWGGSSDDTGRSLGDGAAFDLAAGTWRVLAPAPIEPRTLANVAWTGTEMLVVGGFQRSSTVETGPIDFLRDGGAYNPSTDTWRRLPEAPYDVPDAWGPVWTGNELIIVSIEGDVPKAAAYSPERNEWRTIADPPGYVPASLVWAGEALLMTGEVLFGTGSALVRYDPQADEWQTVDEVGYAYLAAVPDSDGVVREVLALPTETGAPVAVLDRAGNVTGSLPGPPGELADTGGAISDGAGLYTDQGTWLGEEVLFWILGPDPQVSSRQTAQPWALNPETGTWRSVGAGTPPLGAHLEPAASAGILIGWGSLESYGSHPTGIAYRPPELGDDQAIADGAVLTPDDVPMSWDAAPPEVERQWQAERDDLDRAFADCLDIGVSNLQGGGPTATSAFVNSIDPNDERVVSEVTVFPSATEAAAAIDRLRDDAAQRCYLDGVEQQIAEGARDGIATISRSKVLSGDDVEVGDSTIKEVHLEYQEDGYYQQVGEDSLAFRLEVSLSSEGVEVPVYVEVAFARTGRVLVETSLRTYWTNFVGGAGSAVLAIGTGLTRTIVDRIPGVT